MDWYDTNSWCHCSDFYISNHGMEYRSSPIEFYIIDMVRIVSISSQIYAKDTLYIVSNAIGFALNSLLLSLIALIRSYIMKEVVFSDPSKGYEIEVSYKDGSKSSKFFTAHQFAKANNYFNKMNKSMDKNVHTVKTKISQVIY